MIFLAGKGEISQCRKMARQALQNGSAYQKLKDMISAQGGDIGAVSYTHLGIWQSF